MKARQSPSRARRCGARSTAGPGADPAPAPAAARASAARRRRVDLAVADDAGGASTRSPAAPARGPGCRLARPAGLGLRAALGGRGSGAAGARRRPRPGGRPGLVAAAAGPQAPLRATSSVTRRSHTRRHGAAVANDATGPAACRAPPDAPPAVAAADPAAPAVIAPRASWRQRPPRGAGTGTPRSTVRLPMPAREGLAERAVAQVGAHATAAQPAPVARGEPLLDALAAHVTAVRHAP